MKAKTGRKTTSSRRPPLRAGRYRPLKKKSPSPAPLEKRHETRTQYPANLGCPDRLPGWGRAAQALPVRGGQPRGYITAKRSGVVHHEKRQETGDREDRTCGAVGDHRSPPCERHLGGGSGDNRSIPWSAAGGLTEPLGSIERSRVRGFCNSGRRNRSGPAANTPTHRRA